MIPGKRKISRALISVFDKTGLLDFAKKLNDLGCLLYTSPSPRDKRQSRMPSSA